MSLPAPLIVFDLDGTPAGTAGGLLAILKFILTREGLEPNGGVELRCVGREPLSKRPQQAAARVR